MATGKNDTLKARLWMSRSWRFPASTAQGDWDEMDVNGDQISVDIREILDSGRAGSPASRRAVRRARTVGHSVSRMLKYTVSRTRPDAVIMCCRKIPSSLAPIRAIAA